MTPGDEKLRDLRDAISQWRTAVDDPAGSRDYESELASDVVDAFEDLDRFVLAGGTLPTAWRRPAPRGAAWLAVATLPKGVHYVVVPPDGQPVEQKSADALAEAVDWHPEVHAVGHTLPVWRAESEDPDEPQDRYRLPAPWSERRNGS